MSVSLSDCCGRTVALRFELLLGKKQSIHVDRSTLREQRHAMHLRLIVGPNTILGRSDIYSALRS